MPLTLWNKQYFLFKTHLFKITFQWFFWLSYCTELIPANADFPFKLSQNVTYILYLLVPKLLFSYILHSHTAADITANGNTLDVLSINFYSNYPKLPPGLIYSCFGNFKTLALRWLAQWCLRGLFEKAVHSTCAPHQDS